MNKKKKVVVIDDEPEILIIIKELLEMEGFEVKTYTNATNALADIEDKCEVPALVLTDWQIKDSIIDGLGVTNSFKTHFPIIPVLIMTGNKQSLPKNQADFVFEKPLDPVELTRTINEFTSLRSLRS